MPLFSIIVPYYNDAKTIRRCIDSVVAQTFPDWELLLVDDGSDDKGCETAADPRIKRIRQAHQGASAARNRGMRDSVGDYLLFLDADDYLGDHYLQDFADGVSSDAPDICLSGLTRVGRDGSSRALVFPFSGSVSKEDILPSFFEIQRTLQLFGYVAGKAVRRAFQMKHRLFFDETLHQAEDLDFFLRCYDNCPSFRFIPNTDYHYIRYEGGTSLFRRDIDYFSLIAIQKRLKRFCDGHLSEADETVYLKNLSAWTSSAIWDTRVGRLHTLPRTIRRIRQDGELRSLCPVQRASAGVFVKVLFHRCRLFFGRLFLRLCPR